MSIVPLMMDMKNYDVLIAGGGMVGLALGIALSREGMKVAVIERGEHKLQLEPEFDGRVSAIALGSQRVLSHIGAWDAMSAYAEPILDIRVSDGNTPFFLHYDHQEVGKGPFGYILENRYIRYGLQQSMPAGLRVFERSNITAYTADSAGVDVTLNGGVTLRARLLVGADGRGSQLRELAHIGVTRWGYGQTAIVATIAHSLPHDGLALERFLPAGPFAVLPMTGNRSSLVWVEPDERIESYINLPEADFAAEIQERIGGYLGDISVLGKRFTYKLSLQLAREYTAPRLALIGDAAHGIHPLAGQGVNLGYRDVAVLAQLLAERFKLGLDIGGSDTLAHYQRWRRFDNVTMAGVMDILNRLFLSRMPVVRMARGLGLLAVGKMPKVKRFFMAHAMGITGDLPAMMQAKD